MQRFGVGIMQLEFPHLGRDGILCFVGSNLAGRTVNTGICHGVAAVAVGLELQELRALSRPDLRQCLAGVVIYGFNIHAIDLGGRNRVGERALVNFSDSRVTMNADLVVIVLTYEQYRKLPQCCHVKRLVERALVDRPVAKEADHRFG